MGKLKILIAEDDKTTQKCYDVFLPDSLFEKRILENGEETLEAYRTWQPDLMILDIRLPGLSGYSILKTIREEMGDKTTPIMMCSSLSSKQDVTDCARLGIQGYLTKPVEWKVVAPAVLACYEKAYPDKSDMTAELKRKLEDTRAPLAKNPPPEQGS